MKVTTLHPTISVGFEETLCIKLWRFRLGLESQAGESIAEMEAPVVLLLSDLCVFAGLSEEQHSIVLGEEGMDFVNETLTKRWTMKMNDSPVAA
jgi:hypothetical protein